jgi:hypothetical protein
MLSNIAKFTKSTLSKIKHRLRHKLEHFTIKELKNALIKGGVPLLVIIIGWEIIEDILFPVIFAGLGWSIHPVFYTFIPVTWLLCLHWLTVPILWALWLKFNNKKPTK